MSDRYPFTGPCAFCGHPDSRHRITDAIDERVVAGEASGDVVGDYGLSWVEYVSISLDVRRRMADVTAGSSSRPSPAATTPDTPR